MALCFLRRLGGGLGLQAQPLKSVRILEWLFFSCLWGYFVTLAEYGFLGDGARPNSGETMPTNWAGPKLGERAARGGTLLSLTHEVGSGHGL